MRRAAQLVVASWALVACAQGDKDVPFVPSDAVIDSPASDTGNEANDAPGESSCTPADGATCTVFPQCGCSATQNCNVTSSSGATSCVAAGSDVLHESCSGPGECQKGMQCVAGLCVPFCATDADCTNPGSPVCKTVQEIPAGGTTPMDVPGLKVCLAQCDVQNPSAVCGPNTSCFFPYASDETTACASAGTSTFKSGCATNPFACAPGYVCTNKTDCFKWCRIGAMPSDCVVGYTCTAFTPAIKKGTVEYGVCKY
jgi:hypothetical protein